MLRDEKVSVAHLAIDLVKSWKYSSAKRRPPSFRSAPGIRDLWARLKAKKTAKSHWLLKLVHFNAFYHNLRRASIIKPEPGHSEKCR